MVKTIWAVACLLFVGALAVDNARCAESHPEQSAQKPTPAVRKNDNVSEYRIGPEDILRVSVWENRELSQDVTVRPDGMISLPLVQDIKAEGLTAMDLAAQIQKRLLGFIKDPIVSVIVQQVNAPKIYVMGSVVRPGLYPLRGDMSVLHALSLAGGFTQFASPRSIKVVRGTQGVQKVIRVNYYNLLEDGGEGNYLLRPGDTIVVP